MSTIKESPGPKISPYMQILYGLFNILLLGVMIFSFLSVGGFKFPVKGGGSVAAAAPATPGWHTPARVPQCSMDACFNYSRCDDMSELRVFHYNKQNSWFFREAFERSPYYTSDPSKACLFFVTVDRHHGPFELPKLPHWSGGLNHVVISIADNWVKTQSAENDIGMASTLSSITHQSTYRAGFDISVPVPQKKFYPKLQGLKALDRKWFLTFKGTRYLQDSSDAGVGFRSNPALRGMHNGKDIVVATTCKLVATSSEVTSSVSAECAKEQVIYNKYKFDDLMNSTFGLAPAGRGPSSFRLLEVLSAGSIPVVISDNFVLPFDSLIEWRRCAFVFPTSQVHRIVPTLRSLSKEEISHRQRYCLFIYREFLSSDDKIVASTAMALKARFFGVLPKLHPKVPSSSSL
jgi:glucuronyl/N-acetylglucosaminyl transferase EXT1